jgi:hypothetical protein
VSILIIRRCFVEKNPSSHFVCTYHLICLIAEDCRDTFIYWTEKTDNQIERLDKANINFEIRHGEIWIREKDIRKVMACPSYGEL